jgi:hypothetical protein
MTAGKRRIVLVGGFFAILAATLAPATRAGDPPAPKPAGSTASAPAAKAAPRTIAYRGHLPYCSVDGPTGDLDLEFALYETPTKGVARWREKRPKVHVEAGRIDLALGEITPIPEDLYTATFRFVGIKVGDGKELTPRLPVVNTLWVHADGAAKILLERDPLQEPSAKPLVCAAGMAKVPLGEFCVDARPREAATWVDADAAARAAGGRLPSREEWLLALRESKLHGIEDMTGHYEWTAPWLFDPTDGSDEIQLYSGKVNGCSFEELSPEMNKFRYRIILENR